jgi:glutamine---fructose-6-phosphate transaminase (isomerizing)
VSVNREGPQADNFFTMCGIVAVTGSKPALPILLTGLSRLEYRGYDSAGVVLQRDGLWLEKKAGKLANLLSVLTDAPQEPVAGIGHTRWATHGKPVDHNAHPHIDHSGDLAIVHNGIIENYVELKEALIAKGHAFTSETDTEVLAHVIGDEMAGGLDLVEAVRSALKKVDGSFAIAVLHAAHPDLIVGSRRGSPLICGRTEDAGLLASDIPAILSETREIYVIEDDHIVEVRPGNIRVTTLAGEEVTLEPRHISWDLDAAEKGGFDDFMLKEIHEQPTAIRETLRGRTLPDGRLHLDEMRLTTADLSEIDRVSIVGCGTSFYAGLVAKYAIEHWTRMPCEVDVASEFRYRDPVLGPNTLVVGISQSGESLDTMEAIRFAKRSVNKAKVLTVSNVVDSSMAREADAVLYTHAGPEIGVAATKTHLAQIVAMQQLALYLAQVRGTLHPGEITDLLAILDSLPGKVEAALAHTEHITALAHHFANTRDFYFLGRGVGYPTALEGALKLKEISYVRAEAYPAGEMKHGPIALIEPGSVVIGIATKGRLHSKLLSNMQEMRARGATIVLVANEGDEQTAAQADFVLPVPELPPHAELFTPAVNIVPLQIFAYALSRAKGFDVDKPRNLAKTVTVE